MKFYDKLKLASGEKIWTMIASGEGEIYWKEAWGVFLGWNVLYVILGVITTVYKIAKTHCTKH